MIYRILFSIYSINLLQFLFCQFVNSSICQFGASAQRHIVYDDNIASLQVVAGTRWQEFPLISMGESINISFDELSHEYHRYTYTITHLESDFTESTELLASDYISGFQSGLTIDDYEESINTTQNYTHYSLRIPNRQCKLRMSGNYRLDVYEENTAKPVLSAFFMVCEDAVNVYSGYTTDTDIDVRQSHQQVNVKVDYAGVKSTDPRRQIKGYVIKNYNWDNAVILPQSTGIDQRYLTWEHCRDLIFDGGNEYHKFEILDIHRNSMNVEDKTWDPKEEMWHTYLWPDYRRPSYVYDETPKGAFYIRNSDNIENDVASEYVTVHFTLQTPQPFPYPVYVEGMWATCHDRERYRMAYNADSKTYTVAVPLKYGYYSYQYTMIEDEGNFRIPPTEGSFYETRNKYNVLIYYRGNIDRADRLVGYK